MNSIFKSLLPSLLGLVLGLCVPGTQAAVDRASDIPVPQPWSETTWREQLQSGPRPAAYLFTTSYCSTCPDAFETLSRFSEGHAPKVALIPVMMDVGGARAQRHAQFFTGLTALYAFDGFEPTIRQTIDPKWPNVTPYIVLVDRHGKLQRSIGPPSDKALKAWLR